MATPLLIAVTIAFGSSAAMAQSEPPRIDVDGDSHFAEAHGLPAISGDGSTVAVVEYFETLSEATHLTIQLIDTSNGRLRDTVVVYEVSDLGSPVALGGDGWGSTLWRRAQRLNERFRAGGYRPLQTIGGDSGAYPVDMLEGAGLRILQNNGSGRYAIREAVSGRLRLTGRLDPMLYYCGMEDPDADPRDLPPRIRGAWWDHSRGLVLLAYGHAYGSCMCFNDVRLTVVQLDR